VRKRFIEILRTLAVIAVLSTIVVWATPALAATADITVTATPSYVSISCNKSSYDFGVVAAGANVTTDEGWAGITNDSSVVTDHTISVTTGTWSGGVGWTHSDTAIKGEDQAGMLANKGGTWGTGDVIVKNASPNILADNQAANTGYSFGLTLLAPSSFTDGAVKSITVRVTAVAAS
jgi:hypothetical protein